MFHRTARAVALVVVVVVSFVVNVASSSAQVGATGPAGLAGADPVAQATRALHIAEAEQNPHGVAAMIVARWSSDIRAGRKWNPTGESDLEAALVKLVPANLALAAEATSYKGVLNVIATGRPLSPPDPADVTTSSLGEYIGGFGSDLVYTPITPCRIADTRVAGGVIAATTSRQFDLDGSNLSTQGGSATGCNIPFAVAAAAVLTFTVVSPASSGFLTAYDLRTAEVRTFTVARITGVAPVATN